MKEEAVNFAIWVRQLTDVASNVVWYNNQYYETDRSVKSWDWTDGALNELWEIYQGEFKGIES